MRSQKFTRSTSFVPSIRQILLTLSCLFSIFIISNFLHLFLKSSVLEKLATFCTNRRPHFMFSTNEDVQQHG